MNCQETEKFIHAYLDGEFAEEDRRDFELHLRECARCRAMARFEERFKTALRARVRPGNPPHDLAQRLVERLRAEPLPASSLWRWSKRVVPVSLAAGVAIVLLWPRSNSTPALSTPEMSPMPAGVVADNVIPPTVPPPRFPSTVPYRAASLGSHAIDLASSTSGFTAEPWPSPSAPGYGRVALKRLSMATLPPGDLPVDGLVLHRLGSYDIYFGVRRGRSIAVFRHQGRGYRITADMPVDELQGVVQTMLYR